MISPVVAGVLVATLAFPLTAGAQETSPGRDALPLELRRAREATLRRPIVHPAPHRGEAEVMARAGVRGLLITTEVVAPAAIRRLMRLVSAAPDTLLVVDNAANVADLGREAAADGVALNLLVDVDVGNRRTGIAPGEPALALARAVAAHPALRFRGLQGYAGHCAHVIGWSAPQAASRAALAPLMETRSMIERAGLPVEIVAGGSTGTWDIDIELPGLTELQAGSYCVMDLDYRRIGGRSGETLTDFEMALTVITTVVSVPTSERAMVDGGLKAFSTH